MVYQELYLVICQIWLPWQLAGNGENDDSGDQDWYFDGSLSLLPVTTKGQELYYYFALSSMVSIDLSSNYLIGGIPEEITSLKLLKNLNLSRNYLNGRIPHEIGFMQSLESLDLSSNKFSGEIPPSLSEHIISELLEPVTQQSIGKNTRRITTWC